MIHLNKVNNMITDVKWSNQVCTNHCKIYNIELSFLLSKTALRKICYTIIDTASILQRVNDDKDNPRKLRELSKVISQVLGLFLS